MKGKIFNAQEVQAIIAGTKTMFREVIKPRIKVENYKLDDGSGIGMEILLEECPYQVGQKIFCKEAWGRKATGSGIAYKADNPNQLIYQHLPVKWRLPQHMKQEHSRITLEITDVKVERLKDINATHKKPEEKFEANPFVWVVDFKINK